MRRKEEEFVYDDRWFVGFLVKGALFLGAVLALILIFLPLIYLAPLLVYVFFDRRDIAFIKQVIGGETDGEGEEGPEAPRARVP